ncbi:aspartate/glutamate racemase family protein [Mesorhizobium sp. ZC-5]|uniref:aspartate/glutamate racemase family protein n=1 Tax=Mesorhizobium sp. ZC-5 TaxID=2986066 RepID=UPI0021E6F03A|nr:aspartate/glutamate racemase family protein [Mesorhizobium sp. ZC-5]MCV3242703.1 aspartate/glutamate racemase family protein [Mesorhizobium sp. ZC-5]
MSRAKDSSTRRIILVHAYRHSLPPIEKAFRDLWPEAEALNLVDESLYADVTPDGVVDATVPSRMRALFAHCLASGAHAIVFTGSTFGPVVEEARLGLPIPIFKSDEAMAEEVVARGGKVLLVCTARRAAPVIAANIEAAARRADATIELETLVVDAAKEAISKGDIARHDQLIADAIAGRTDVRSIVLGQLSMSNVPALVPAQIAENIVSGAEASVRALRSLLS